ncbi:hypothetical protein, partial [Hydrogenophaga sp.]|uniref:hypothetical protein n=1 Tax=Hydrogenophaga sp. TaxID=1904254 RepID=UPI003563EF0B
QRTPPARPGVQQRGSRIGTERASSIYKDGAKGGFIWRWRSRATHCIQLDNGVHFRTPLTGGAGMGAFFLELPIEKYCLLWTVPQP